MTNKGVAELYMWLTTAWPLVIRPGADDEWKRAKMRDLARVYFEYTDAEVLEAFQKWTDENEKFPTTKNILTEIRWARLKRMKRAENEELHPMDIIYPDGNEYSYGFFKRADFVDHPRNPEHLSPEEWERRFNASRNRILRKLMKLDEMTPQQRAYAELFKAKIREAIMWRREHQDEANDQFREYWEPM